MEIKWYIALRIVLLEYVISLRIVYCLCLAFEKDSARVETSGPQLFGLHLYSIVPFGCSSFQQQFYFLVTDIKELISKRTVLHNV